MASKFMKVLFVVCSLGLSVDSIARTSGGSSAMNTDINRNLFWYGWNASEVGLRRLDAHVKSRIPLPATLQEVQQYLSSMNLDFSA